MATISGEQKTWHKITLDFEAPQSFSETPETFRDYRLDVVFTNATTGESYRVPGFFAADGDASETGANSGTVWRVNFNPPSEGEWTYETSFRTGNDIAASTNPNAGQAVGFIDGETGGFSVAATDKGGEDFRAKGMILQDEGTHYLQHQGDGDYFIRGGPGVPENFLATADFDGWRRGFDPNNPNDPSPGNDSPNNVARHQFAEHLSDFSGSNADLWSTDGENATNGQAILGAVDYLSDQGQNTIYLLTNTIGGDGQDVSPWVDPNLYKVGKNKNSIQDAVNDTSGVQADDFSVYDVSKLDQWERLFDYMDERGIYKNVLFQETENDQLLNGGTNVSGSSLSVERLVYMREMIARFGHNNGIQWNLGEENTQTDQQRIDMAEWAKAVDPYDHLVVIHTFPGQHGQVYDPLLGVEAFDGPSFQTSAGNIRPRTTQYIEDSADAGDPWVISWDEDSGNAADVSSNNTNPDETRPLREGFWGHLTAGGTGANWYLKGNGFGGHSFDQNLDDFTQFEVIWDWTEAATSFFNTYVPFWEMTMDDGATSNGNDFVMSKDGDYYVIYAKYGAADDIRLDLSGHGGESFDTFWYDPRNGGPLIDAGQVSGGGFVEFDNPPNTVGKDWVLFVRNSALPDTPPSVPPSDAQGGGTGGGGTGGGSDPIEIDLRLIEPGADSDEGALQDGATVDLDDFTNGISVSAVPDGSIGSAVFSLDGAVLQTENIAPYALFGDTGGDFKGGAIAPGSHELKVDVYSGSNGGGQFLGSKTVSFDVLAADDGNTGGGGSGGGGGTGGGGTGGGGGGNPPPPSTSDGAFIENDGLVVIEFESASALPDAWRSASSYSSSKSPSVNNPGAAAADDFIVWEGPQYFNNPGNGQITYQVQIETPGLYTFDWHNQVGNGTNTTEHNDTWLKIDADAFYAVKGNSVVRPKGASSDNDYPNGAGLPNGGGADGWFKVYSSGANNWKWSARTSDSDAHTIVARFDAPGVYDIHISARSSSHILDRMILVNEAVYDGNPRNLNLPESNRVEVSGVPVDPPPPPPPNLAPTADPDSADVTAGDAVTIDVLANDSDPEGDPLTIELADTGSLGTASLQNGQILYTANGGDGGTDQVTYRAVDSAGNKSALTTVTIAVAPQPQDDPPPPPPPPAPSGPLLSVALANTTTDQRVADLENDATIEIDGLGAIPLTIYAELTADGQSAGIKSVVLDAPGIDKQTESIEPYALFGDAGSDFNPGATLGSGDYSVTVTAFDKKGGKGNVLETQTINFTLTAAPQSSPPNTAPIAVDDAVALDEDTTGSFDVLANDNDAEGGPLTIAIVDGPDKGSAEVQGGQIVYTPGANENGADSLSYTLTDAEGLTSDAATVSITINPVNDAPVLAPLTAEVEENAESGVLTYAGSDFGFDPDGSTLFFFDAESDQGGQVTLAGEASILQYAPAADFVGTEVITVTLWDQADAAVTSQTTVTVEVTPEADADPVPPPDPDPSGTLVKAVNIGGQAVNGTDGIQYEADTYSVGNTFGTGNVEIAGTDNDALFRSEAWSPSPNGLNYGFAVEEAGTYRVELDFAEIWSGAMAAGARVFDIAIEDVAVEQGFDIYEAVGFRTATTVAFTTEVADGVLDIALSKVVQNPKLSAIRIFKEDAADVAGDVGGEVSQYLDFFAADPATDVTLGAITPGAPLGFAVDPSLITVYGTEKPGSDAVESVTYAYGGKTQVENFDPYAVFGDLEEDFLEGSGFASGPNVIDVTVHAGPDGTGAVLEEFELSFTA
ncbi:MAG: Ig-like domain-containing protein [Pseudomonadota bacterium]